MNTSLIECAEPQLRALAAACDFSEFEIERSAALLTELVESWGSRPLLDVPRWSGVTDDCSPLEFSLGLSRGCAPELRFMFEAQDDPAGPLTYWAAAERLNSRLELDHGACLERLHAVADLFRPTDHVYGAMFHGVGLRPGKSPLFKAYLNPKAQGERRSRVITREAFARLGLLAAWESIAAVLRPEDELQSVALDLAADAAARVKLYVRHRAFTRDSIDRAFSIAANNDRAERDAFIGGLFVGGISSFTRPPTTTYAVTTEDTRIAATLSVWSYPALENDAQACERVSKVLAHFGLPATAYERSLKALARRALHDENGIHTYVSFQSRNTAPRVTVYLTPRMYLERLGRIGSNPVVVWPTPAGRLIPLPQPAAADDARGTAANAARTISQTLDTYIDSAMERVKRWDTALSSRQCADLTNEQTRRAFMLRSFVDGYWRIRRTEPMIELAIDAFERSGDATSADFWRDHLPEEAGHDAIMLADIERITGSPAARDAILEEYPITPPSAALVGYFEWQVRHNKPHLLIVMRYFLETFFARIDDTSAARVHEIVAGESATLTLHREADADHVEPCRSYIDRNFTIRDLPALIWSVDFLALSLRESQSWAAWAALSERAA